MILAMAIMVSGCATALTQQGMTVRRIQYDWAADCEFVGVVEASEAWGNSVADDQRSTLNQIRNQAALMGGNAFALSMSSSNLMHTLSQADVYYCPNIKGRKW